MDLRCLEFNVSCRSDVHMASFQNGDAQHEQECPEEDEHDQECREEDAGSYIQDQLQPTRSQFLSLPSDYAPKSKPKSLPY